MRYIDGLGAGSHTQIAYHTCTIDMDMYIYICMIFFKDHHAKTNLHQGLSTDYACLRPRLLTRGTCSQVTLQLRLAHLRSPYSHGLEETSGNYSTGVDLGKRFIDLQKAVEK